MNPSRERAIFYGLGVFGLLLVGCLWLTVYYVAGRDRAQTLEEAGFVTRNLASAFEEHTVRVFSQLDLIVTRVKEAAEDRRGRLDRALLAEEHRRLPELIAAIAVANARGDITMSSPAAPPVNVADRDFFKTHAAGDGGPFIGKPVVGRLTGRNSLQITRRIDHPGGAFAGIAGVSIALEYLGAFYRRLDLGPGSAIALIGLDGVVRARQSDEGFANGMDVGAASPVLAAVRQGRRVGTLLAADSPHDGARRIVSYRALDAYPLVVAVAVAEATVLSEFEARRRIYLAYGVVASLLIAGSLLALGRLAWHQQRARGALLAGEARYRQMFQSNPLPMWIRRLSDRRYLDVNDAAVQTYGYSREEFLAMRTHDLIPPADREAWELLQAQPDSGRLRTRLSRHRRKDGSVIDVEMTSHPIDYDGQAARLSVVKDVTERKRAEDALRENQYFMQKAQKVAHIGYWISGPAQSGERLVWSPEAHRIFGIPEHEFDGRVETFFSLVHPDDLAMVRAASLAALQGRMPYRVEHRIMRADGAVRWVYQEADITFDDEGRPRQMFGVTQDITERKEAELQLRKSEARLAAIIRSEPECVKVVSATGELLEMNQAGLAMLEADSLEAVRQRPLLDFIEPGDRRAFLDLHNRVMQGGSGKLEFGVIGLKGGRRRLDTHAVPLRGTDGAVEALLGITRDVTERRRMEHELQESEARYRSLFEMTPSPILLRQGDTVSFANPAALRFFGAARPEDIVGKPYLGLVDAEDHGRVRDRMSAIDERGERTALEVRRFRRLDGRVVIGETSGAGFSFQGRMLGIVAIHDVTDRAKVEQALRENEEQMRRHAADIERLNADLEQRVVERTRQLELANQELESFAYSVSHDLRAPLRSIDGFSKALLEDYDRRLDDEGRDYLQRVRRATQRMAGLIDDLLSLSRVSRVALRQEAVDLAPLAREIVDELRRQEPERDVAVAVEPSLVVRGDPNLLRIVLENLLQNAWKFTSRTRGARIEVGKTDSNGRRTIHVRDNGVGFDMAYAGKLFGAFQRLHAESEFPGTGIGLATVQRILSRHGGEVRVEAAVDAGATIFFTLDAGGAVPAGVRGRAA